MDRCSRLSGSRASRPLLLAVLVSVVVVLAACDWVQPGYDAGQSGYQPNETTLTASNVSGLRQLFAVPVGDAPEGAPGPVKAGGGIFVTSCPAGVCTVSRRDTSGGALVWSKTLAAGTPLSPVVWGSSVIVAAGATLASYDATTGAVRWSSTRPDPIRKLAVSGNHLVTSESAGLDVTYSTSIEVLRAADGALEWSKAQGVWPGGFTVGDGVVYANRYGLSFSFAGLDAYDLATGTLLRTLPNCPAGNFAAGRIYHGAKACDATTGAVVWSDPATSLSDPAIDAQSLFLSTYDTNGVPILQQFDAATGARGWSHAELPAGSNSQPAIANGVVYVGTDFFASSPTVVFSRAVTAYRESDGQQLFSVTVPGSAGSQESPSVIVAQGRIYFLANGTLYAYGL